MLYPYCVEEIVKLYKQNPDGAIFYGTTIDKIDAKNNHIEYWSNKIESRDRLLKKNYDVSQPGSFYRKDSDTCLQAPFCPQDRKEDRFLQRLRTHFPELRAPSR